MKLPYSWLKDYTDIEASAKEYSHILTMTGSKVEGWEHHGENITGVVCGRILDIAPHQDSDHLLICKVDAGTPLQIVTGAKNLKVGDMVPVALDGAQLPAGPITTTTMRGQLSQGMLCSFSELGLTHSDCPYADPNGIFGV